MKFRIIRNGLGLYYVQQNVGNWLFPIWSDVHVRWNEYPKNNLADDYASGDGAHGFVSLKNAQDKLSKEIFNQQRDRLRKQITVVQHDDSP